MRNYIYYREGVSYPSDKYFRPSENYPEYPFSEDGISEMPNDVYDMIRDMFIRLELDISHVGSTKWNPLGEYITDNNIVLIKPNWVIHENEAVKGKNGLECLVTHTSVVKCIIDYVVLALHGTGKIIVADAPVQSCDFGILQRRTRLRELEEFYKNKNINIEFVDLRNYRSKKENGNIVTYPTNAKYKGVVVNVGKKSYFYGSKKKGKLRITNYDYHKVNQHHRGTVQEYCISEACLEADVIINLPKPKTHRKAGFTGALKNMIGVSAKKDYLPHHTKGAYITNEGDEYYSDSKIAKIKSDINDVIDILDKKSFYKISGLLRKGAQILYSNCKNTEKYSEGSWWGNNTIWKTILDLNTIVLYSDKIGQLKEEVQRKVITLGDMIISGENEGPLIPSPKKTYSLLFADNNVLFDEILTRFMGFQVGRFKLLTEAQKNKKLCIKKIDDIQIYSNRIDWEKTLDEFESGFKFEPPFGWKGYI